MKKKYLKEELRVAKENIKRLLEGKSIMHQNSLNGNGEWFTMVKNGD